MIKSEFLDINHCDEFKRKNVLELFIKEIVLTEMF